MVIKSRAFWFGVAAGTPMVLTVSAFMLIFVDPYSKTSQTISEFQTLLAGALALYAAVLTVIGVYFSANIPIDEERVRSEYERERNEIIGATIILSECTTLAVILHNLRVRLEDGPMALPEVIVPSQFKSFELLSTQRDTELNLLVVEIVLLIDSINLFADRGPVDEGARAGIVEMLGEAHARCQKTRKIAAAKVHRSTGKQFK